MRHARAAWVAALLAAAALQVAAEETFDVSAFEKKAFEWNGFIELRPEWQSLRRGSAGYTGLFPGQTRDSLDRRAVAAEVSGVLRHQALSFNFTGHASSLSDARDSDDDARMYEAYAAWQIDPRSALEVGKRALRWGKGYAFSPVAFLERPKDPVDPELAREGFVMATGAWVRSFAGGPLTTLSLSAALVPTSPGLNEDFGPGSHLNPAVKLYGLVYDTDVDLVWAARGSRGPRVGVDFSRNLGSNLEVHGEWARTAAATPSTRSYSSVLLGLRWLTESDTTVIFELYRNGSGYMTAQVPPAGRPSPAQRYAYLRVSQKEPFDILDFTPSVTLIANTRDRSYSVIPELAYTGIRNVELRLRLALNRGDRSTEYGEKAVRSRVELRARFFF